MPASYQLHSDLTAERASAPSRIRGALTFTPDAWRTFTHTIAPR
ncbi:hypothetical protein [Plantactinospora mayteni]|nr:hypothetical protein [Plantactinospora mayteni]